jgi:hypothetical protein
MGRDSKRLDLVHLEEALAERGVGTDLSEALTRLGFPPSAEAARRRAGRTRSEAARQALRDSSASWPEPWSRDWANDAIGARIHGGLSDSEVETLVRDVRRLLDFLDRCDSIAGGTGLGLQRPDSGDRPDPDGPAGSVGLPPTSITEIAATLFGSAHALDPGTRLAAFASRALQLRVGQELTGRELWEAAGVQADRVSAPALVWRVPAAGDSVLAGLLRGAALGGLPLHVSLLAMSREPVTVPSSTQVLAVENPRLVEAAAERRLGCCVVSTNGNPTTAVTTLLQQLQGCGARLWYHGDFDAAGIAICRRMHDFGCRPWMMDAQDYRDAVSRAGSGGVRLERDTKGCGPTPWDPTLEEAFESRRLIVHEEFVLDEVLGSLVLHGSDE